jgi:hypothetical protein
MGCLLIVLVFAMPVAGLLLLSTAGAGYISRRLAQACCPACGYEEAGRDAASPCPECGRIRVEAEKAVFVDRPLRVLWPLIFPVLVAVPFVYFSAQFTEGERAWAVACLVAPFLWLMFTGIAARVHRLPLFVWACVGVPSVLMFCAAAWTFTDLAKPMKPYPGMYSYVPVLRRQFGPVVFAGACALALGTTHVVAGLVLMSLGRRRAGRSHLDTGP